MIANKMTMAPVETFRAPPHSREAEVSTLAAIMAYGFAEQRIREAKDRLSAEMFYFTSHQDIFRTIVETGATDAVAVAESMERLNRMGDLCFADVLTMANASFTMAGLSRYVDIIRERHAQRHLIGLCHNTIEQCSEGESAEAAMNQLQEQMGLIDTTVDYDPRYVADMVSDWVELAEKRQKKDPATVGIETGIESLDKTIIGIGATWLFILAGRPSHGKSLFAQMMANHISLSGKVLFMSMEMTYPEIMDRVIAMVAGCDPAGVRSANLTDYQWAKVTDELSRLKAGERGLYFDDTPSLTVEQVCARAKSFKRKHPDCALIQIDYLGLMETPKADRNDLGVGKITKRLKQLAKEINTPVMLLAQLNREADKAKRPAMHNLADSASIERDADYVMFTHSLGVAHPENLKARNHWMLITGKHRHGDIPEDIYINKPNGFLQEMAINEIAILQQDLDGNRSGKKGGFDL